MRLQLGLPRHMDGNLWLYTSAGRMHPMHHHPELEFNLVTRGTGLYRLAARTYRIRRGDLLWLFPAQEHGLAEFSPDFEMWIGVFKSGAVRRISADAGASVLGSADPTGSFCRRLTLHASARLGSLFSEVVATRERLILFNAGLSYALLSAWQHFERAISVPVRETHPAVEKAIQLIRAGSATMGLVELARCAGLSPSRLSRLFKQQTGLAFVDFRNRVRVERFLELYGAGQRVTMLEAALHAGFGSYPQFHRTFRRVMGCPPGRYR
jgi:AraC-like DNA-binding protein